MLLQSIHNPIISDVQNRYVKYRQAGKSRAEAIRLTRNDFSKELQDADDRLFVLSGLFLALGNKHELLKSIATETLDEIQRKLQNDTPDLATHTLLMNIAKSAADKTIYGEESPYKRRLPYRPDWSIGDAFSHIINFPAADTLGIKGWLIIFYKVGEYIDEFDFMHHLMLVYLAPPHRLPKSYNDLLNLGLLPMMQLGAKKEYLAQVLIKSKKQELGYELTLIGHFPKPSMSGSSNYIEENPLTAMPLFGRTKPEDAFPGFEDQICRLYKRHGKFFKINGPSTEDGSPVSSEADPIDPK